jgi:hypothetical protein
VSGDIRAAGKVDGSFGSSGQSEQPIASDSASTANLRHRIAARARPDMPPNPRKKKRKAGENKQNGEVRQRHLAHCPRASACG